MAEIEPMKAKDMLDMRHDLQLKLLNRNVRDFMAATIMMGTNMRREDEAWNIVDATMLTIERAENFFVSADMCELIAYSTGMFDESDKADVTLPPVDNGFVYFEKPFDLHDIQGATVKVNAMLWRRTPVRMGNSLVDAFICHMWNDQYRTPDDIASVNDPEQLSKMFGRTILQSEVDHYHRLNGRWGYVGMSTYADGQDIGPLDIKASEDVAAEYEKKGVAAIVAYTNVARFFHAFWLMMAQPLAEVVKSEEPDRATRKRMAAANLPSDVTVIQFRRRESKKSEGPVKKVNWTHRWMVRGFWRWQPYKVEGEWIRKRIWIAPTIKGPEDKPLVLKQKVNAFVR